MFIGEFLNRNLIYFFLLFFIFPISPVFSATKLQKIPVNNTNLVGYWTMDGGDINWATGKVMDRSGRGNNGDLSNLGTTTSTVAGKIGQSLYFGNQTPKYINAGSASALDNITLKTICAWIYPRSFGSSAHDSTIVSKWGNFGWLFQLADDDSNIQALYFWHDASIANGQWHTPSNSIVLNTWQHVCVIHDNSSVSNNPSMYINGVSKTVTRNSQPNGIFNPDDVYDLYIGNIQADTLASFDGYMDDVRVYNSILSPAEVNKIYNFGSTKFNKTRSSTGGTLDNGLVGYWTFDGADINWVTGRVLDKSVQSNGGNMFGLSTTTSPKPGKIGQSLKFIDTVSNYVMIDPSASLNNLGSISISLWIKATSDGGSGNRIITKLGGSNRGWGLWWIDGALQFEVNYDTADLFKIVNYSGNTRIPLNQWVLITVTWDGSSSAANIKMYANGIELTNVLSSQNGSNSRDDDSGAQVTIAARSDTGGPRFDGLIDDTRIYNRVLSLAEVKQLYNSGVSTKVNTTQTTSTGTLGSGLVGYWTMDGKDINWSQGSIQDKSLNGTIGYLVNMSTTSSPKIGKIGQALRFVNGDFSYVDTKDFGVPDMTGPYTISAWIYPVGWGGGNNGYIFRTDNYTLSISASFSRLRLDSPDSSFAASGNNTIVLNKWQHVVAVYNGSGTVTLYIDGIDQTSDSTMSSSGSGGWVYISDNTGGASFDGLIDDVRTYDRALSATEIKRLYSIGR